MKKLIFVIFCLQAPLLAASTIDQTLNDMTKIIEDAKTRLQGHNDRLAMLVFPIDPKEFDDRMKLERDAATLFAFVGNEDTGIGPEKASELLDKHGGNLVAFMKYLVENKGGPIEGLDMKGLARLQEALTGANEFVEGVKKAQRQVNNKMPTARLKGYRVSALQSTAALE